jgi:CheY-like chemotaxis protein
MRFILNFDKFPAGNPKKEREGVTGILLVDDDPLWLDICEINLRKHLRREIELYKAFDGREAAAVLAQNYPSIQIILLDLNMPEMMGMDFYRLFYDRWGLHDIGVFIITAYGDERGIEEARFRRCVAFYDKSNLDYKRISTEIENFLDIIDRPNGLRTGFYVDIRPTPTSVNPTKKTVVLKWIGKNGRWETFVLGAADRIGSLKLPNLRGRAKSEPYPPLTDDERD